MELAVGEIYEGKVTGITKYGAFVTLEGGKSGLVHISEIADSFVSDVHDHVQLGQTVRVKVLGISPDGKINLSLRKALPAARQPDKPQLSEPDAKQKSSASSETASCGSQSFEDRLKKFMQESDSRIADNRMYSDRRQRSRRR